MRSGAHLDCAAVPRLLRSVDEGRRETQRRPASKVDPVGRPHVPREHARSPVALTRFDVRVEPSTWPLQESAYALSEVAAARLALPDDHNSVPEFPEFTALSPVPQYVRVQLGFPELRVAARHRCERATRVAMPEATMDEHGQLPWEADEVGRSG